VGNVSYITCLRQGCTIYSQTSRSHLKISGSRRLIWCKFYNEGPQILSTSHKMHSHQMTWREGFVHPCGRKSIHYSYVKEYIYIYIHIYIVVVALRCQPEGLGIDPQWCHWGFFPKLPTETCALGSTQPLKMSIRKLLGVKTAGAYGWRPYHLHSAESQENPEP
jgi:hypothetical protein